MTPAFAQPVTPDARESAAPAPDKLYQAGTGTVFVHATSGTLQPTSSTAAQRLLIGYPANSAIHETTARAKRRFFETEASRRHGKPERGWLWVDPPR